MDTSQDNLSEDLVALNQQNGGANQITDHSTPTGHIHTTGDMFHFEVDVSEFSPEDVVITSSNNLIEVSAEKIGEDGTVTNTFSHKCRFPVDMEPMSLSSSMGNNGVLTVKGRKESVPMNPIN